MVLLVPMYSQPDIHVFQVVRWVAHATWLASCLIVLKNTRLQGNQWQLPSHVGHGKSPWSKSSNRALQYYCRGQNCLEKEGEMDETSCLHHTRHQPKHQQRCLLKRILTTNIVGVNTLTAIDSNI